MGIRAIIWDLGGVILRTEDWTYREKLAARLNMSRPELELLVFNGESGVQAQLGKIDVNQHWENLRRQFNLTAEEMDKFIEEFWAGDRLDELMVNTIRSFKGRYKTGLLSNAFSDLRRVITEVWKIPDVFDHMIISAEVGLLKPDAAIYRLALDTLGVEAQEAIFLDDFKHNIVGAQAVGMHGIQFLDPGQAFDELNVMLTQEQP